MNNSSKILLRCEFKKTQGLKTRAPFANSTRRSTWCSNQVERFNNRSVTSYNKLTRNQTSLHVLGGRILKQMSDGNMRSALERLLKSKIGSVITGRYFVRLLPGGAEQQVLRACSRHFVSSGTKTENPALRYVIASYREHGTAEHRPIGEESERCSVVSVFFQARYIRESRPVSSAIVK